MRGTHLSRHRVVNLTTEHRLAVAIIQELAVVLVESRALA